ncbi:hypothetical protein O181_104824 [Austropuccinia psidii MF-1]|uniref:Uncharacterized protein n=1 Tax=Austropuccinia psidii MF-1 TaxID=1389203 RepID=A0A9Q3JN84_9BASI|nr:hypothetical protein [Austropuccinia psidii MF-1]
MGVAELLTWNQVGPIGHIISFMANWSPLCSMASGHILPSLASLANRHITNPQAFIFDFGPGGSGPPSHHLWFWDTPFHWGGLGLNGLIGPFRPPTASAAHGPPQGRVGPKPQLGPPEPILATNPLDTKMAIEPIGPIFGHGLPLTIIPEMASGNHQRPPDQLSKHSPQLKGKSFHSSMHPVLKVAGVVHIWYYIPLCTIFAQQSNGGVFRNKSHNSN